MPRLVFLRRSKDNEAVDIVNKFFAVYALSGFNDAIGEAQAVVF